MLIASLAMFTGARRARSASQQTPAQFGGRYAALDSARQRLVDDWVVRFGDVTGQKFRPEDFYDTYARLSTKTTFDAITQALMTTALTDASGKPLGHALDLVEHVDSVKGQVVGATGDHQFRMYVRLTPGALGTLAASRQFKRVADNSIYHKGYPINIRGQGGLPSIQFSVALDGRRADIDVNYRPSSFPTAMFNGHLIAANSDVRAGDNYAQHAEKWAGFQDWWRNVFGVYLTSPAEDPTLAGAPLRPTVPRAGRKSIDVMTADFLNAWLVEGDIKAAMGYVSERAYACLAEDADDPAAFDRGMAPFVLMHRLKVAHDAVPTRDPLDRLVGGVPLSTPGLRLITLPQAQFAVYEVADDVAGAFDCESRLSVGAQRTPRRAYGNYFGSVFYIKGPQKPVSLALLWAREQGYLKIVSWLVEPDEDDTPPVNAPSGASPVHIKADPTLVAAAQGFLQSWLIRKDYNSAFQYISPAGYACYDLLRGRTEPAATSLEDAGRQLRAGLERSGNALTTGLRLEDIVEGMDPVHPLARIMDHPYSHVFTLTSVPNAVADEYGCAARARGVEVTGDFPLEYGDAFGMNIRFRTLGGETPVLRALWRREDGAWRIVAYDIEMP